MSEKSRQFPLLPIVMIALGAGLIISSVVWFINRASPEAVSSPTAPEVRIPFPEIRRISLADAKAAYDLESAIFIDTRGEPYYSQGHIVGALSITEEELPDYLDEFDRADWIILYCT